VERTGRRERTAQLAAALLVACVALGAGLGAGIHPATSVFRAEASLNVAGEAAELHPTSWHTAAQALQLAPLRARIARISHESPSSIRVGTAGDPQGSLITFFGEAGTPAQAKLLANAATTVMVQFLTQTGARATVTRSTFDHSSEAWDLGPGVYVLPPRRIASTRSPAHTGRGSLEVACDTVVIGGCGPYLRVEGAFRKAVTYQASGWINARAATRVRLILGATPQDVAVGATRRGDSRWQQLRVSWSPKQEHEVAVLSFQVMSLGTARFYVDDVVVGPRTAIRQGASPPRNIVRYETVLQAESARRRYTGDTAAWAAGGAGAGLLVGAVALAAAAAARRRRAAEAQVDIGAPA
jgi:hypothetical protein